MAHLRSQARFVEPPSADSHPQSLHKKALANESIFKVAEREGFEPPEPFGSMVFKTTAIDHSAISPLV